MRMPKLSPWKGCMERESHNWASLAVLTSPAPGPDTTVSKPADTAWERTKEPLFARTRLRIYGLTKPVRPSAAVQTPPG